MTTPTPTPTLEQNPALPTDTPPMLAQTLSRIFRLIAQVVNPIAAWVAKWANITPGVGSDGSTSVTIAPTPTGNAILVLNKPVGSWNDMIQCQCVGKMRWQLLLGDYTTESGANAGSDFQVWRYDDTGTNNLGKPITIYRNSGLVQFTETTAGVQILGTNGLNVTNGQIFCKGTLSAANGMGMFYDGNIANYLCMGAGIGGPWSWQWNRQNGLISWINSASASVFSIDGTGIVTAGARFISAGGTGLVVNGTQSDGSTYSLQSTVMGNPAWNSLDFRTRHQYGVWAGYEFVSGNSPACQVRFTLSNGTSWGTIAAASFDVQSDERIKSGVAPLPQQHDAFMGIVPISWQWPTPPEPKEGDPPIYPDLREKWGFSAQNMAVHVPLAVNGSVIAEDPDGKPLTATVDPIPISALTVLEVQALWGRIAELDARVSALEAV